MRAQLTKQERQDIQTARELVEDVRANLQAELEGYHVRSPGFEDDAAAQRLGELMDDCQTVIDAITQLEKDN